MENQQKKSKGIWKKFSWIGVLLIGILSKLKSILPLLKLGKFGGMIVSMGVSLFAYAILYPWWFAFGLVVMIFIHEMGHVWAARKKNLPVTAPAFIPFLGALITMKKMPQDAVTEAYIAYGGPLLGTIGALGSYGLGLLTNNEVFFAIALVGFFLNLFNLIPISPLDGGRIVVAVSRWIWIVGVIMAVLLIILMRSFILLFVFGLFLFEMWARFRNNKGGMQQITYRSKIPVSRFTDSNTFIPGEKHQRELTFTQYCDIDSRNSWIDIRYPGVGRLTRLPAKDFDGEVHQIKLVQTKREDEQLEMFFVVRYMVKNREQDRYYQVPPMTRLKYGLAYFGLAAFLVVMTEMSYMAMEKLSF